jgi:hypothetical protein
MARTTPVDNHVEKARRWRPAGLSLQGPDREGEGTSASRLAWAACDVTHLLALTLPRKLTRRRDTGGRAKEKGGRSRPELQGEQQPEPWPLRRDHTHDPDRKRLITVQMIVKFTWLNLTMTLAAEITGQAILFGESPTGSPALWLWTTGRRTDKKG